MDAQNLVIPIGSQRVSGLLLRPAGAKALYLFAHGAAVGMTHKAMESNAQGLAQRGIATLRYQFLYMEKGQKRPDPPPIAHAGVRAAAAEAVKIAPDLPLFAGGRSFGGRMTSQTQRKRRFQAQGASPFWASRCTPPASPAWIARITFSPSRSRCCSCQEAAMRSRISTC